MSEAKCVEVVPPIEGLQYLRHKQLQKGPDNVHYLTNDKLDFHTLQADNGSTLPAYLTQTLKKDLASGSSAPPVNKGKTIPGNMDSVKDSLQDAKEVVIRSVQSGTEPASGVQGAGTVDQPYDQGNATKSVVASGTEPPSGIQGQGTVDSPYDQGNQPEQTTVPHTEPPSGVQGKGTIDQPYDGGNQPEQPKVISPKPTHPVSSDPLASPSTTHQGSGNPQMEPTKEQAQVIHETRGRDESEQRTTSTPDPVKQQSTGTAARGGNFDAAKPGAGAEASRLRYEERDVSPGEMKDGSHAVTSGTRGEGYTPGKFNKLKDKFGIGKH